MRTSDSEQRVRRSGLTLIELLLVIALLLAASAIVVPAMFGTLRDRALDSAADTASEQLVLARAHAQSTGRPVEVVYREDPPRTVVRYFSAGIDVVGEGDRRAAELRGQRDPFAEPDHVRTDANDGDAVAGNWSRRLLPAGIRLHWEPPEEAEERGAGAGGEFAEFGRAAGARRTRVAAFMPDGSALLTHPVWIAGQNGRAMRLDVNQWTGLPSVKTHEAEDRLDQYTGKAFP